jgi:EAL domain-containing protein (putative c-di-GMP-specific phosphodiesterase class I)
MDRSFLKEGQDRSGLSAAIVAIGNSLGLEVVAEGIERPEQMASLRELGCPLGQGFLFAKPMNSDALLEYLVEDEDAASRLGEQPESHAA